MRYGRAFILGGKYKDVVRQSWAKHKAVLFQTRDKFLPNIMPLIKALVAERRSESIEVYGLWDDGHSFSEKDYKFVIDLAKKLQPLAAASKKEIYYAPFLEARRSRAQQLELFQLIEAVAPNLILVNSAIAGGGEWLNHDKYKDELHLDGGLPKPRGKYLVSVDGRAQEKKGHGNGSVDMPHQKFVSEHPNAFIWMDWVLQDNGKKNTKDDNKRKDRKAWLTKAMDDSVCRLSVGSGNVSLPKGHLWKSHAEQHTDNCDDPNNNRPVYISNGPNYKRVQIVNIASGKVMETVTNGVKYKHGPGYLYRFKKWGWSYGRCKLVCDGKEIGVISAGFRIPGR